MAVVGPTARMAILQNTDLCFALAQESQTGDSCGHDACHGERTLTSKTDWMFLATTTLENGCPLIFDVHHPDEHTVKPRVQVAFFVFAPIYDIKSGGVTCTREIRKLP